MNLRHDVTAGDGIVERAVLDDAVLDEAVDRTILDHELLADELLADELAGTVELVAAFLGWVESGLASGFERFTCGIDSLEEMRADLRADLWRLGAWIRVDA